VIINKRQSSFQIRSAFVLLKRVFIAKCRLVSFRAPFRLSGGSFKHHPIPIQKQTFTNRHTRAQRRRQRSKTTIKRASKSDTKDKRARVSRALTMKRRTQTSRV
jgi:hypothetical protein